MKHIRWLLLGAILAVCSGHPVQAQSTNLPVNGVATWCWDGTNWVGCEPSGGGGGTGTPGGAADSIQYNATGGNFGGIALSSAQIVIGQTVGAPLAEGISGDGGMTNLGVLTITKTNGTAFGALATVTPGTGVAAAIANAVNTAGGMGTIGTSGATVGLLNGNNTFSGNDIFSGGLTFSGLTTGTQVSCIGLTSGNVVALSTGACGSGGGSSWNLTDGTTSLTAVTALTVPGGTLKVGGTAGAATLTPIVTDTSHTTSATTANIGGQDDYNGSSITATLATLAAGQTLVVTDQNATALTLALGGQTVNGLPLATTLHTGGFYGFSFNTTTSQLSGFGFPGFGTITSGALMKYTDASGAATAGDLSGDCTTSGSLVVTCAKGSASTFGIVKVDGVTVTASGGVISAVGGAATTITPGTTTIAGATAPCTIRNTATTVMGCTAETGTGSVVLSNSPTLVTPALGTPSSGVGTNLTGIPNAAVAAAPLPTPGSGATLVAPRSYYVCTTTCTVTPPVPAAGDEFCIMNDDNVSTVITMAAIGTSARYENTARTAYGTAGTGTFVSGGAVGDKVCLLGRDSTHYLTVSFTGTWVAN